MCVCLRLSGWLCLSACRRGGVSGCGMVVVVVCVCVWMRDGECECEIFPLRQPAPAQDGGGAPRARLVHSVRAGAQIPGEISAPRVVCVVCVVGDCWTSRKDPPQAAL